MRPDRAPVKQLDADRFAREAQRLRVVGDDLRARAERLPPDDPEAIRLKTGADHAEDAARGFEEEALDIAAGPPGDLPTGLRLELFIRDLEQRRDEARAEEAEQLAAAAERFNDLLRLDIPRIWKLVNAGDLTVEKAMAEFDRRHREAWELVPPLEPSQPESGLAKLFRELRRNRNGERGS